jgi:hypothetical protein
MKRLLQSLLAVSASAKSAALEVGILDICLSELRNKHALLCADGSAHSKKGTGWLGRGAQLHPRYHEEADELNGVLGTLTNLLFKAQDAKHALARSAIPAVLAQLWPLCILDDGLIGSLLKVHCNIVAGPVENAVCLIFPASDRNTPVRQCIQLANKLVRVQAKGLVLALLFEFLAAAIRNTACRGVMMREKLIDECISHLNTKKKPCQEILPFLAAASAYRDAQAALCRSEATLAAVLNLAKTGTSDSRHAAAKTFRNICSFRQARVIISGNSEFMATLQYLAGSATPVAIAAKEAIWLLLKNANSTLRRKMWVKVGSLLQDNHHHPHCSIATADTRTPKPEIEAVNV